MAYDDDQSSDPDVTPPPYDDAAAARAWKHADDLARDIGRRIDKGFERFGSRQEQQAAQIARMESQIFGLQGNDGRGGEIGRVNGELAENRSTKRWAMGQSIGLGAAFIAAAIAIYTRLTSLEVGMAAVSERQQTFEQRVERTLDKLEARASVPPVPKP